MLSFFFLSVQLETKAEIFFLSGDFDSRLQLCSTASWMAKTSTFAGPWLVDLKSGGLFVHRHHQIDVPDHSRARSILVWKLGNANGRRNLSLFLLFGEFEMNQDALRNGSSIGIRSRTKQSDVDLSKQREERLAASRGSNEHQWHNP